MTGVVMLTPWLSRGYGLAEVVAALSRELTGIGIPVVVGALDEDGSFPDVDVRKVGPRPSDVARLAGRTRASVVIAHGSPFLEMLPDLPCATIAYEHGDPTPEMFTGDSDERRRMIAVKRRSVYPRVDAVVAISEFVRHDIDWPSAEVIRNGADHVPDLGRKPLVPPRPEDVPLRVGSLVRLGAGEAHYKGTHLLAVLHEQVQGLAGGTRFELMGRGEPQDAQALREAGVTVHLNATDDRRHQFLRELDVFVSLSQWEGCNLPLLEAQALGTPALAFDTGAHPEFTPFIFPSVALMARQIEAYGRDPDGLLRRHAADAYDFVRPRFRWSRAGLELSRVIARVDPGGSPALRQRVASQSRLMVRQTRASVAERGVVSTAKHAARRIFPSAPPPY